jgi:D-glycero-D-manno-heptose 1,7-bisphosphate phosphatase
VRPAVFLDRDGVVNRVVPRGEVVGSPRSLGELVLVDGAAEAVARLRAAGYLVFVVTNQPDLARGLLDPSDHERIMDGVRAAVGPDELVACPHDDADGCGCRKPRPGMLTALASRWGVALERSYMVGDGWKDMAAGRAAGCRTVLVRAPYNGGVDADAVADGLVAAVELILGETTGAESG